MKRALLSCLITLAVTGSLVRAEKIYVMNPDQKTKQYPTFSVGVTGLQLSIEKGLSVTVQGAIPDSPAADKFTKGQIVTGVNGTPFGDNDPVVMLGEAIGAAEAKDGTMAFAIKDGGTVTVEIPVLGPYSDTWPLDCRKSQKIIAQTRRFILGGKLLEGSGIQSMLAALFMMSTGEQEDLDAVVPMIERIADKPTVGGGSNWPRGYQGILMAEYYLRTGDDSVLPGLKKLCDGTEASQYLGGWAHGGLAVDQSMGYVQSGMMNPAGAPILTALILAKECGVPVKERVLSSALLLFYRFAGHAAVPYGDHRPECWMSCNGKNGMLAAGLQLFSGGPCRQAGLHLALDMADSYRWVRAGHTGGGFDVIWRSITAHNVPENRSDHYRNCLRRLAWYYDLSRQPGGGFSMVGEGRYGGTAWGIGMGLLYTAPLRTLRITGMAPTRHSRKVDPPPRPWGNELDEIFLGTDYCEGFGREELEIHEIFAAIAAGDKAVCVKMLKHYSPVIRETAAKKLAGLHAVDDLAKALEHPDPRVRRAVCEGISNDGWFFRGLEGRSKSALTPEQVSAAFLPYFVKTLEESKVPGKVALWETDEVLYAFSKAKPEDIRANLSLITPWLTHEDWYLRESAFYAMLGLRDTITLDELCMMAEVFANEQHSKAQGNYAGAFKYLFGKLKVKLADADQESFAKIVARQIADPKIPDYMGRPAAQQCVFKAAMLLKGMDKNVHASLQEEYARYLKTWQPDTQHAIWLVAGSRWTQPMSQVLESMGKEGKTLCQAMKATAESFDSGERTIPRRDPGTGGAHLKIVPTLKAAVAKWETEYGEVTAKYPE